MRSGGCTTSALVGVGGDHRRARWKTVADWLGRANAAMPLRVYAHAFAKSGRAVADSVGASLMDGDE